MGDTSNGDGYLDLKPTQINLLTVLFHVHGFSNKHYKFTLSNGSLRQRLHVVLAEVSWV